MGTGQARCRYCGRWFRPDPRVGNRQVSCGQPRCRREHVRRKIALWRKRHPEYVQASRETVRLWAAAYPDYWRHRRKRRPGYVRRDNLRRRASRKLGKSAANVTARADFFVEKLEAVSRMGSENAANVTEIFRRTQGLVEALLWRERAAKRNPIGARRLEAG